MFMAQDIRGSRPEHKKKVNPWPFSISAISLAINLAAVANTVDAHDANFVGNLVNHAVVTYADAPVVLGFAVQYPKTPHVWQNFDRMNRMNRIYVEWRLNSESVFYPVNPVYPVKMSSLVAAGRAGSFALFRGWFISSS